MLSYSLLILQAAIAAPGASPLPAPPPAISAPFPDVPASHWAADAVESLRRAGIVRGYPHATAEKRPALPVKKKGARPWRKKR